MTGEYEKLKPCPFCGGEAKILPKDCWGMSGNAVKCKRCFTCVDFNLDNIAVWQKREYEELTPPKEQD